MVDNKRANTLDKGSSTEAPEHLAPLELAARIFCRNIGVDPDELVRTAHPIITGAFFTEPFWHRPAEEMLRLSAMLAALKEAHNAEPKGSGH